MPNLIVVVTLYAWICDKLWKKEGFEISECGFFFFHGVYKHAYFILFYNFVKINCWNDVTVLSNPNQIKKNQTKKNMNIKKKLGLYWWSFYFENYYFNLNTKRLYIN
jgi:hypothetical protein